MKQRLHQLFEKYVTAVRTKLRRLGLEGADLDDMVQTVYAVANRRIAKIPKDDEGSRRWLLDAARKHAANWHRLYRHTYETLDAEAIERAPAQPEDTEAYLELRNLVQETGKRLDPIDREILLRHELDGESLQEIARWLGLTKSGAHVRLTQARERFALAFEAVQRKPEKPRGLLLLPVLFLDALRSSLEWLLGALRSPYRYMPALSGPTGALLLVVAWPATPRDPVSLSNASLHAPPPPPPVLSPPSQGGDIANATATDAGAADAGAADAGVPRRRPAPKRQPPPPPPVKEPPLVKESPPAEAPSSAKESPPAKEPSPEQMRADLERRKRYASVEDLGLVHYSIACFQYGKYDAARVWIKFHRVRHPNSKLKPEMDLLARMVEAATRTKENSHGKLPRHPDLEPSLQRRFEELLKSFDLLPPSATDTGTDAGTDAQEPSPTKPDAEAP